MIRFTTIIMVVSVVLTALAVADVPTVINYQGRLTDKSGDPVVDGDYEMRFSIYNAAVDGELLWSEAQELKVIDGLFAVALGSREPIVDSVFEYPVCYLSIMVMGDEEILPRTMLVTVPWAFRVSTVDGASGGTITSKLSIGPGHSNSGSYSFVTGYVNRVLGNYATIGGGTKNRVDGDYSAIPGGYADTIDATADYSYLFGIGSRLTQDSTFMVDMPHIHFGNEATGYEFPTVDGTVGQMLATDGTGLLNWTTPSGGGGGGWVHVGSNVSLQTVGDRVGIGTSSPIDKLHVAGGLFVEQDFKILGKANLGPNSVGGTNTFASGVGNNVGGDYSVAVGFGNQVPGNYSFAAGNLNQALGSASSVGGGQSNIAANSGATVSGGESNAATANGATVGGGKANKATGVFSTVGGGTLGLASGSYSVVAGGGGATTADSNIALGSHAVVGGGRGNVVEDIAGTIAGGSNNIITVGDYSTIAGGGGPDSADGNLIDGKWSFIGGGRQNYIDGDTNVICGGSGNAIQGVKCFIGGGGKHPNGYLDNPSPGANYVAGGYSSIVGGADNYVEGNGEFNSILGGERNRIDDASGGSWGSWIGGGEQNWLAGNNSVLGGGELNTVNASWAFCGAGFDNEVFGQASAIVSGGYTTHYDMGNDRYMFINRTDPDAIYSFIGAGWGNRTSDTGAVVLGGVHNYARGKFSVVVGGGGSFNPFWGERPSLDTNSAIGPWGVIVGGKGQLVTDTAGFIGGGGFNRARGRYSVVVGGGGGDPADSNVAFGDYSFVGAGRKNVASGDISFVGAGSDNIASGAYSVVTGGRYCEASGAFSFAGGYRAKALHSGAFVWADPVAIDFNSTANSQFSVRASGGVRMFSNFNQTSGVTLAPGASSWTVVSDSTLKRNIREVNYQDVLEKVAELPISQWSYESQDENIEHVGPMAQDFYRLFGLGEDDKHINTLDPDGVALAAIKALHQENQQLKEQLSKMEQRLAKLETR